MTLWLFVILYGPVSLPPDMPSPRVYTTSLAEEFTDAADCEQARRDLLIAEAKRAASLERGRIRIVGISEKCTRVQIEAVR